MCRKTVELIVPCYNEEQCIDLFYNKVKQVFQDMQEYQYIITFIDDGSKDNTLNEIKKAANQAKNEEGEVRFFSLSRNFGKESAMYAGLEKSIGDYVVIMDADLQHPPELLNKMLAAAEEEGYDCATARRISRKGEPVIRSFFSRLFYQLINKITVIDLVPGSTDYRLMKRSVVQAIVSLTERERFTKGIYAWAGFKNKWIEYENIERAAGETKWSFLGLIKYAYSGFVAFATTPLRSVVWFGMVIVLCSVIYGVCVYIAALHSPDARSGYASIIIIMLFLGGSIITILGMIGEYLARIYMEVKRRPIYFIRETNVENDENDKNDKNGKVIDKIM